MTGRAPARRRRVLQGLGPARPRLVRPAATPGSWYDVVRDLAEKQQGISLITLRSALEERGLPRAERRRWRSCRSSPTPVPTAAHIEHHAEIVKQKATARALIRTCEKFAARGYDGLESVTQLVEDAEREVLCDRRARRARRLHLDEGRAAVDVRVHRARAVGPDRRRAHRLRGLRPAAPAASAAAR